MLRVLVPWLKLPPVLLPPLLLLPVLLSACDPLTEGIAAASVGSVTVLGRTPIDAGYSLVTGKDCSAVRLEQGKTYCRPTEPLPDTPPYCTRSLGVVDCWQDPASVSDLAPQVADGPRALTPTQEKDRTRSWPNW
jgi:hypothetical protein